jgi:hypothetical protein
VPAGRPFGAVDRPAGFDKMLLSSLPEPKGMLMLNQLIFNPL